MLKQIRLKNFQAHKDTTLEFSDKVTALYGTTDNGKSSIVKALDLFFTQRPLGNRYIRRKQKENCEIQVTTDESSITFERNKDSGSYCISGDKDNILTALRGNVPEEVSNLLKLEDINTAKQFDPLFLILDTPGKAASKINAVTHLEKADEVIKNLSSKLRKTQTEIKVRESDIKQWEADLDKYKNVLMYEKTLNKALDIQSRLSSLITKEKAIGSQIYSLRATLEGLEKLVIPDITELSDKIEYTYQEVRKDVSKSSCIAGILNKIYDIDDKIDKIGNLGNIDSLDNMDNLINEYTSIVSKARAIEKNKASISKLEADIAKIDNVISNLQAEFDEKSATLDKCDKCGQILNKEAIEYMLN